MFLTDLKINNFRLLKAFQVSFDNGFNIFCGKNAQGKTTILEAIRFLSIGRSFITKTNKDILSDNESFFFLNAKVKIDKISHDFKFNWSKTNKLCQINGKNVTSLSTYIGKFNTVLFTPQDFDLVTGPPENKRRYIDIQLSQINPSYLENLKYYYTALRHRNAILKKQNINEAELDSFTFQLIYYGAKIIETRAKEIPKIENDAAIFHKKISNETETLKINYKTFAKSKEEKHIANEMNEYFKNNFDREKMLGYTILGPHKDDLDFSINGESAKKFASRGQLKSIALSLKFAESLNIKNSTKKYPILLIDDVFSELDFERKEKAISFIPENQQVFIATTSIDFLKDWIRLNKVSIYNVNKGKLL